MTKPELMQRLDCLIENYRYMNSHAYEFYQKENVGADPDYSWGFGDACKRIYEDLQTLKGLLED